MLLRDIIHHLWLLEASDDFNPVSGVFAAIIVLVIGNIEIADTKAVLLL